MTSRAVVTALNLAWAAARRPAASRFRAALARPEAAQAAWLARFLRDNARTAYGRAHRYAALHSPRDFQRRVPVVDYDALDPWVARVEAGEREVLTREPVRLLERTSGGARGPKLIPYTAGLLEDFGAATGPWLDDLAFAFPALFTLRQYWSVSPAGRAPTVTSGGVRVGLEDDTEYFDAATRFAMRRLFAVDGSVARLDLESWRTETLRQLLAADDLGFFSVWNPSFLTLLMEALEARRPELVRELSASRRADIEARLEAAGAFVGEALWPRLQLISCWTDAWAQHAVPGLRRFFPTTPLQGKGLLATEGVVSFPLWGQPAPVAAVTSHFLEFEALEDPGRPVRLLHELVVGAAYAPLLTTRGGFARYRLPDVVRCVGHLEATPLLRFEGRLDRWSDLRGEKLDAAFVERALAAEVPPSVFALVAPEVDSEPPRYVVYVERADAAVLAARLEDRFLEQHHYRYCRDLGQLGPVEGVTVRGGAATYVEGLRARGVRLGDIKPAGFDPLPGWRERFTRAGGRAGDGQHAARSSPQRPSE
jgi:hypothetical protein